MNDFRIEKVYFQFTFEKLKSTFNFLKEISIVVLIHFVLFFSIFFLTCFVCYHRFMTLSQQLPVRLHTYNDGVKNNNDKHTTHILLMTIHTYKYVALMIFSIRFYTTIVPIIRATWRITANARINISKTK